jgi:hypothetical protein
MDSYPILAAAPGMTFEEVKQLSSVPVGLPSKMQGFNVAYPTRPHRLRFEHEKHGFMLPPSRFAFLEGVDGKVVGIRTSPQLDYTNARDSVALIQECEGELTRAKWAPKAPFMGDEALLRARVAGEVIAQELQTKGLLCQIRLKWVHSPDSPIAKILQVEEDLMLVTLFLLEKKS